MKPIEIRQSNSHPKLFIATGNAFDPNVFGADGIAAFVKDGFSATYADYTFGYKKNPQTDVSVYEYHYGGGLRLPQGWQIEGIVKDALDELSANGCKSIIMPPIRTADKSEEENDSLIVEACLKWLLYNDTVIDRLIIADKSGQMIKKGF